jgi:hypothetical protein
LAICAGALVYAEAPVFVPLVAPLAAAFGVDVAASTAATAATAAAPEIGLPAVSAASALCPVEDPLTAPEAWAARES